MKEVESLKDEPTEWDTEPCPYCGGRVIYTTNSIIYHGRQFGNGMCYVCTNCWVSCGVHGVRMATRRPLGLLANDRMKKLKSECHHQFDQPWKNHEIKRKECYHRLADLMDINVHRCHFGWFNEDDLDLALRILKDPNWWKRGAVA